MLVVCNVHAVLSECVNRLSSCSPAKRITRLVPQAKERESVRTGLGIVCELLLDECLRRGSSDNISVVLVSVASKAAQPTACGIARVRKWMVLCR